MAYVSNLARSLLTEISEGMGPDAYVAMIWHIRDSHVTAKKSSRRWPIRRVPKRQEISNVVTLQLNAPP